MTNKIHIGIIPDGNRRWCKENNYPLSYLKTHWVSKIFFKEFENLYNIFQNKDNDKYKILSQINEVSLYVLSLDNIIQRGNNSKNIQTNYSILKIFYAKFKENYDKYEKRIYLDPIFPKGPLPTIWIHEAMLGNEGYILDFRNGEVRLLFKSKTGRMAARPVRTKDLIE